MLKLLTFPTLLWILLCASLGAADTPVEPPHVPGYLIVYSGSDLPPLIADALVKMSGGAESRVLYLTHSAETDGLKNNAVAETLKKFSPASINVLNIENRDKANDPKIIDSIKSATAVWIAFDTETDFNGTALETELLALLRRDGTVGGTTNWLENILPNSILNLHPAKGGWSADQRKRLASKPGVVGYSFDAGASLFAHGRNIFIAGGNVSIHLGESSERPGRDEIIQADSPADLVALTRASRALIQAPFPPAECEPSEVEGGTLVIDGGGIPKDALLRFIQAAGGPDELILVVPTALDDNPPLSPAEGEMLKEAGAKNVKTFHLSSAAEANDFEKIKILNDAKGIWFCGGRQWRYVDAYLDTPAEKLMHALLKRGGAIGGSSAGATIQGEYLVRGNPLGNQDMMAQGYERGLGFLKGVAIDQHFVKRRRFADMTRLKKTYPQLLGMGIDEGAAVVVTGHMMEVVGRASVCVYDKKAPPENGEGEYVSLNPGDKYDLKSRLKIENKNDAAK